MLVKNTPKYFALNALKPLILGIFADNRLLNKITRFYYIL
jgi:hypothetical protein